MAKTQKVCKIPNMNAFALYHWKGTVAHILDEDYYDLSLCGRDIPETAKRVRLQRLAGLGLTVCKHCFTAARKRECET